MKTTTAPTPTSKSWFWIIVVDMSYTDWMPASLRVSKPAAIDVRPTECAPDIQQQVQKQPYRAPKGSALSRCVYARHHHAANANEPRRHLQHVHLCILVFKANVSSCGCVYYVTDTDATSTPIHISTPSSPPTTVDTSMPPTVPHFPWSNNFLIFNNSHHIGRNLG